MFRPVVHLPSDRIDHGATPFAQRHRHGDEEQAQRQHDIFDHSPHPGRQMSSRSVQINHENDENVQTDTQLTNGKPFLIMLTIRHHPPLSFDAGHPFETP